MKRRAKKFLKFRNKKKQILKTTIKARSKRRKEKIALMQKNLERILKRKKHLKILII